MLKHCPCGQPNAESEAFCIRCGQPIMDIVAGPLTAQPSEPEHQTTSPGLEILLKSKAVSGCPGHHKHIVVDAKARTVTCHECGFLVDPFDYLLEWSREGQRRMDGLKRIEHQTNVAQAELESLERRIKNRRAQLKRAGSPQPPEERTAFDRQRWNPPRDQA